MKVLHITDFHYSSDNKLMKDMIDSIIDKIKESNHKFVQEIMILIEIRFILHYMITLTTILNQTKILISFTKKSQILFLIV